MDIAIRQFKTEYGVEIEDIMFLRDGKMDESGLTVAVRENAVSPVGY